MRPIRERKLKGVLDVAQSQSHGDYRAPGAVRISLLVDPHVSRHRSFEGGDLVVVSSLDAVTDGMKVRRAGDESAGESS